ncbi:actin depolymerizing protein [Russula ochroleuca]|uniref:Actin depolymerizing protein n=1 Tax=Russula ochroleuca TaxID=152965 RepID=A0A9P5MTY8_9AGAM|nr:actin depolymerizing protein [Russula ochroleuca]
MGVPLWLFGGKFRQVGRKRYKGVPCRPGRERTEACSSGSQSSSTKSVCLSIMSATSGIAVSPELATTFADAVSSKNVRFLKISIQNEALVNDASIPPSSTLENDLNRLQSLLDDNIPAYVLVRLDDPPSAWLAVHYVPDTAKVRDKMIYASTRNSVTKSLGATNFVDTIFATSKEDVTPAGYAAHKRHQAAPKPMSAWEKEIADIKAAEREAGGTPYNANAARQSPFAFGTSVGLKWSDDVEAAVRNLAEATGDHLVTMTIDPSTETLTLRETTATTADELKNKIPSSDPSFAFFSWSDTALERRIIFIYSCPSTSPVKHRMLYSSGSGSVYQTAKSLLPTLLLSSRKVETSDPHELDASFLRAELGKSKEPSRVGTPSAGLPVGGFARPGLHKKR